MGIGFDAQQLSELSRDLRRVSPETYKATQKTIRVAAMAILADAEERVSYSKRIGRSGKIRMSGLNATVIFGGDAAPDAAPIENEGRGYVRHPVFGNMNVWTAENSHPAFLAPAFLEKAAEVEEALGDAVLVALDTVIGSR